MTHADTLCLSFLLNNLAPKRCHKVVTWERYRSDRFHAIADRICSVECFSLAEFVFEGEIFRRRLNQL